MPKSWLFHFSLCVLTNFMSHVLLYLAEITRLTSAYHNVGKVLCFLRSRETAVVIIALFVLSSSSYEVFHIWHHFMCWHIKCVCACMCILHSQEIFRTTDLQRCGDHYKLTTALKLLAPITPYWILLEFLNDDNSSLVNTTEGSWVLECCGVQRHQGQKYLTPGWLVWGSRKRR